jgi:peptidyl-prolyl cis-trans isomerase D
MITWMQRHKKWLIITIWISTIAFVGAGFVGWGQYSYGDKAGSVAKVGSIEITIGELQKNYSYLYGQYNQMLNGALDEEKAKQLGLKNRALQQLVQQALILNLAKEYDLQVTAEELFSELQTIPLYDKNKEIYIKNLKNNNMSVVEFEALLTKELLIKKTIALLPVENSENEKNIFATLMNIADKINYKVLTQNDITIDTSDKTLKPFWESKSQNFMSEVSYNIKYIKQTPLNESYNDDVISKYYNENRTHFKDAEGKILTIELAKSAIVNELNEKATKDKALRTYIAYKKGNLEDSVVFETATISTSNNMLTPEALTEISKLTLEAPYMKPIVINGIYHTIELIKVNPSKIKTYEEAKDEVFSLYVSSAKQSKLLELANSSIDNFSGLTTDFITMSDANKLTLLTTAEASEFLQKLFVSDIKRSYISLSSGKVVLYDILEQKMLNNKNSGQNNLIADIKSALFDEGLIKTLENKYQTEIFIQGL